MYSSFPSKIVKLKIYRPVILPVVLYVCETHKRDRRDVYKIFLKISGGKRLTGRPRLRWEDNNEIDLQEVAWEGWTGLI